MTIRHIAGREDWYTITTHHEPERGWREGKKSLHGPKVEASASWSLLGKHGFGVGLQIGRNGMESDIGLDLYAHRLGSVWLRLASPWTKWTKVRQPAEDAPRDDAMPWYEPRHTGLTLFPHRGCFFRLELDNPAHSSHHKRPWWHEIRLTRTTILGRHRTEKDVVESGVARIPMPEGVYLGTWESRRFTTRHVRALGTWRDHIFGPKSHTSIWVNVEGGIPCEGKGENSWDCGMDGVFGTSGPTLEKAIGNYVSAVLRNRERYGGPHDLPRPMTVAEAGAR